MHAFAFTLLLAAAETAVHSGQAPVQVQDGSARRAAYRINKSAPLRFDAEGPGDLQLRVKPEGTARSWKLLIKTDEASTVYTVEREGAAGFASLSIPLAPGKHALEVAPAGGEGLVAIGQVATLILPVLPGAEPKSAPVAAKTILARPATEPKDAAAAPVKASAPRNAQEWSLQPYVGFGFAQDISLGGGTPPSGTATPQFVFGGRLSWAPGEHFSLSLEGRDHVYQRQYVLVASAPQGPTQTSVAEQKVDVELIAHHELLHHFTSSGEPPADRRLQLDVRFGPAAEFFVNRTVPSNLSGVLLGGELRFAFAPTLQLYVQAANLTNLKVFGAYAGPQTLYGAPVAATILGGGVALGRAGIAMLRLGYDGQIIALDRGYRQYQAVTFNLDLAF